MNKNLYKAHSPYYYYQIAKSPVGNLHLLATEKHLVRIGFQLESSAIQTLLDALPIRTENNPLLRQAEEELNAHFAGEKSFSIPTELIGTPFQRTIWSLLKRVPYGETLSYSEFCQRFLTPPQLRAFSANIGRNPLPIIFPCHRILGKNNHLTGFAGGLETKSFLLELERKKRP